MLYNKNIWNRSHVFPFIKYCTYLFMEPFFKVYTLRDIDIISDYIAELHFIHCSEVRDETDYIFIYDTESDPFAIRNSMNGKDTSLACITRIELSNTLLSIVKITNRKEE